MRLLLAVAFATIVGATLPPMFGGRRKGGFTSHLHRNRTINAAQLDDATIGNDWIDQKLDHFDSKITRMWKQQYFYNLNHAKGESTLNILYLSGEEIAELDLVTSGSYVYYATALNASIYALEHRFYGASHPAEDTSTENLKYLSSRQAIEDIAEFIRQKNAEKGGDQKWIVVGGSYAGNLAAWSRLKHPELIAGALASSAPLLAQLDFYGYLQIVDDDFKKQGGLCYDQISKGIDEAMRLMQSAEGRDQLSDTFHIDPPLSDFDVLSQNDIETFYSYLLSPFMYSAQYSEPPISNLCEEFTANGADYDPLKAFKDLIPSSINVNFTTAKEYLTDPGYFWDDRMWTYQTCTEFGYFQSTNRGSNVFGQVYSTRTFIEYCMHLFDIDADQIQKNVDATNEYYGGRDYFAGTNVVFSHGTQDPWSFLTKKSDPKHWSVVIVEIQDGEHCADLNPWMDDDEGNEQMNRVLQLTLENMQRWMDPLFPVPDRVEITDNVGHRPTFYDPKVKPVLPANVNAPDAIRARRYRRSNQESDQFHRSGWNRFTGKGRRDRLRSPVETGAKMEMDGVGAGRDWIEQTWDHFNPNEERTFKQKWYYNYKYGSACGPNFLMIGGEGPEDEYSTTHESLAWMTYAKEVGANVFDLEHRYYGESILGTNDLQYLSSAQMLYDVAAFIRTQQVKFNRTGPWITFGGSYPGALAAWSREWFPELILGAVGSSGPVLAKNDFYEYLEVVENVIKRQSQTCYDRTAEAFEKFRELTLSSAGRKILQQKFNIFPAWTGNENETIDPLDLNTVYSDLYEVFMETVQYNAADWAGVKILCQVFESDKYDDPLDALREAQTLDFQAPNVKTLGSFDKEVNYYIEMLPFIDGTPQQQFQDYELAEVLWMWQTCNEFGYYQSSDYGEGIFGTNVPVNFFITMCERVFGVGMDHIEKGVSRTNYQYGGRMRYNTTNVVLPNGDADPWHALGVLERGNLDESVVPIVINGTSHCLDMHAATDADPPELTQARKTILENIKKWLDLSTTPATTTRRTTKAAIESTTATTPPVSARTLPTTLKTSPAAANPTSTTSSAPTTTSGMTATSFFSAAVVVINFII